MKISRNHSGIKVGGGVGIVARHVEGAMIDDVIEIDAQPKAMGEPYQSQQFCFCAVVGRNRAPLLFITEIERIEQIVTYRKAAPAFGGRRKPEAGITGLGDL